MQFGFLFLFQLLSLVVSLNIADGFFCVSKLLLLLLHSGQVSELGLLRQIVSFLEILLQLFSHQLYLLMSGLAIEPLVEGS